MTTPDHSRRGVFIAFEGGEGSGKTTQLKTLTRTLTAQGHQVVATREPGGTPLGVELRRMLLSPDTHIDPVTEALLYAADRSHHVATVLNPALEDGRMVLTDRYVDSTIAYQGAGRALDPELLARLQGFATGGLTPDLTIVLDIDPTVGLERAGRGEFGEADRIESETLDFHRRVRSTFLTLARMSPARYTIVDATGSAEKIAAEVAAAVDTALTQAAA